MTELKITMWNCSGVRAAATTTAHKMGFFDKENPNANFAIAVFVETHHRGEDDFPALFKEYKVTHNIIHTPTPGDQTYSGIIVFVRKDLEILSHCTPIPGRLLNFKFRDKSDDKVYNISAFYGPQFKNVCKDNLSSIFQHFG